MIKAQAEVMIHSITTVHSEHYFQEVMKLTFCGSI